MKYVFSGFLLLIFFSAFGQSEQLEGFQIDKKDTPIKIDQLTQYYIDETRSLLFDEVKNKEFRSLKSIPKNYSAHYWYKFKINPNIKTKYLLLFSLMSHDNKAFIPFKNEYRSFRSGIIIEGRKIKYDIKETSYVKVLFDSIDFSKPIYFRKKHISAWGANRLLNPPLIMVTNNIFVFENMIRRNSQTDEITIYSSIFIFSFFMFLIGFLITNDKNFLNYSLYLLFVLLIFAIRIPSIFNIVNRIEPKLIHYNGYITELLASIFYLYFIMIFLKFKKNHLIQYSVSRYTIFGMIFFGITYTILIGVTPFASYLPEYYVLSKVIFTLITLWLCITLLLKKLDVASRIILMGSLLLVFGNGLALIMKDSSIFLNTVVIEILLFFGTLSYSNNQNVKRSIQQQFVLEKEKEEKKSLIELNKMKSNFFANISHEFRTPLTLISGPIQNQLSKENLTDDERHNFEVMFRNSNRLLSLVDQLLDISKIEAGNLNLKVSRSEIIPFIGSLCDGFTFSANQKQIDYISYTNETTVATWYDKDIVEKIVVNLLSNAIKYTPNKGSIVCNAKVKNDLLYFTVKNSGKGLTKEEKTKVFERFYQLNENSEGVGIGLALVKELVTLHKGEITVKSTPNEWTTFEVILPINKASFKTTELIEGAASTQKIKVTTLSPNIDDPSSDELTDEEKDDENPIVLIVDDNADIRTYVGTLFKNTYNVLTAQDGREGIDIAVEQVPDIIISDIMMPVTSGIELCNTLKADERTSHIPIILLTAKTGEEHEIAGIKTGADDYITKPFNEELLQIRVEKLLESRKKLRARYSQEVILRPKDIAITSVDEQFLGRMQNILDDQLVESSFSIEEFSKALGMSRMQLHRKLKALTGLSASEFIRSQRLKLAAQLLKKSEINVSQVGYSVGFNDHAYFSKRFKEMYHCTPSEYAKSTKK